MDNHLQIQDPMIGQLVGGMYQIVRLIGTGGMGAVYEAKHVRLPRRFAIKHMKKHHTRDTVAMARFQREAEIASSLGNRHIAEVFDFNVMPDGSPYMVMELLEGEDLRSRLRRGPMELREALEICEQVVSALSAVHERGVVHRDLKPENIFVLPGEDGGVLVKLVDFGLSKVHGDTTMTQSGSLFGTPMYMSPEQARSEVKEADHRSDIYSLAAVMFEALTGRAPFTGETVYALLWNIVNQEPPSAHDRMPSVPEQVSEVLQWAMAKMPGQRPQTAAELLIAIEGAIEGTSNDVKSFESWRRERSRSIETGVKPGVPSEPVIDERTERDGSAAARGDSVVPRAMPSQTTIDPYGETELRAAEVVPPSPSIRPAQPTSAPRERVAVATTPSTTEVVFPARFPRRWLVVGVAIGAALAAVIITLALGSSDRKPEPSPDPARATAISIRPAPALPGPKTSGPALTAPEPAPSPNPPPVASPEPVTPPPRPRSIERVTISVDSDPPGADVLLQGQRVGATPTKLTLPRGQKRATVTLRKDGYLDKSVTLTSDRPKVTFELEFRKFGGSK